MGQALYRKYRSRSLDEVVGQEHITKTLRAAIKTGRISHAYLFTGPRGVGKTSIARILAHELNGVPYDSEQTHLDIIEIDAASNGGVDEIRDLRDKVYIAPANGKYKIYIIDEVHMMTTSAFNALLKTLEEPPAHAIFILATTEVHKLPATIISRTQRFTFKPIPKAQVVGHLRHLADEEKINITDAALEVIAEHGEGSFRDSIGMLDQAASLKGKVDRDDIEQLLGVPPAGIPEELLQLVAAHNTAALVTLLTRLRGDGYQAGMLAKLLGQALRTKLLDGKSPLSTAQSLATLNRLIDVSASPDSDQLLELVLLEAAFSGTKAAAAAPTTPPTPQPQPVTVQPIIQPVIVATPAAVAPATTPAPAASGSAVVTDATWQAVLESLKKQYNTLYGIIRMARPDFQPGKVILTFGFAFHQKRANDAKNKQIVVGILHDLTGEPISVECKYDKNVTPPAPATTVPPVAPTPPPADSPALEAISTVFGGGELLET